MYLPHFGLNQSPFGITPNPAFFYAGNKRGAILEALIYAVTHGEGIIKVTGEVGSGKTMLCRMLESMLPENIEVIYLVNPTLSREQVVFAIAGELGLATGGKRPDEVIRLLQQDLITKHAAGKQVVLLVEEAQAMPLETLEEIRLFSNLETAHHKLLQIVLFGQPELDESLALPRMRQLKERITHSFKVPPMVPEIIPDFLMFRLRAAGYEGPELFTAAAIKLISAVSEGIVRRISILADKALLAAFADNTHLIDAKHVKAAILDSEFSVSASANRRRTLMLSAAGLLLLGIAALLGWRLMTPLPADAPPAVVPAAVAVSPAADAPPPANTAAKAAPATSPAPLIAARAAQPASTAAAPSSTLKPKPSTTTVLAATSTTVTLATSAAAPADSGASDTDAVQQRLNRSKTWLTNQAPQRYSVQLALMSNKSRDDFERFLGQLENDIGSREIYIYPTRVKETIRFGVLHGSFATRAEAVAARTRLTDKVGYRPQLRTIAGVTAEIQNTASQGLWRL